MRQLSVQEKKTIERLNISSQAKLEVSRQWMHEGSANNSDVSGTILTGPFMSTYFILFTAIYLLSRDMEQNVLTYAALVVWFPIIAGVLITQMINLARFSTHRMHKFSHTAISIWDHESPIGIWYAVIARIAIIVILAHAEMYITAAFFALAVIFSGVVNIRIRNEVDTLLKEV